MLNSSTGGTIYIGVSDDGVVRGVLLSQYKVYYHFISLLELSVVVISGRHSCYFKCFVHLSHILYTGI